MFTFLCLHLSPGRPAAIQRGLSQIPRRRATVDATLELTHERVDDVPLLLGFLISLRLPRHPRSPSTAPPAPSGPLQWLAHHRLDRLHPLSSRPPQGPGPILGPGTPPHPRGPHRPDHPPRRVQRRPLDLGPEATRRLGRLGALGSRSLAHPL